MFLGEDWASVYLGVEWASVYLGAEWDSVYLGEERASYSGNQHKLPKIYLLYIRNKC